MTRPPTDHVAAEIAFHRLPWADFDAFAHLRADRSMVQRLRGAERSRRKLLLYALLESAAKTPEWFGPLPPVETVWELLARVEEASPSAFDRLLTHPYTGSWAGYTTRLLRNGVDGVGPLWIHLGHVHGIAAAAAIRAGLAFETAVPLWHGVGALPSLGVAVLPASAPFAVAQIAGTPGNYVIAHGTERVRLPDRPDRDAPGWRGIRRVTAVAGHQRFPVRLDDVDPYRGLYEPVPPQRLDAAAFGEWHRLIDQAWQLLTTAAPDLARLLPVGLCSLVPKPPVLFRNPSASTGEAFGSAVLSRPNDPVSLASSLIHEFQHIVLGGILHLTPLCHKDSRERIYVPWRDDPRPLLGAVQGAYAFLGVTGYWRALADAGPAESRRRAWFEFAYWRRQTWRTLTVLRADTHLTGAGQRFVNGMAEVLGPWQHEPVAPDITALAAAAATDHLAGWRVRHVRPDPDLVDELVRAWRAGQRRPPLLPDSGSLPPTPVPDGTWSHARADLVRLGLTEAGRGALSDIWATVPDATTADLAHATGRQTDAVRAYRTELAGTPDRPASLIGLGLALGAIGPDTAARALLSCPELVRAVHRRLRHTAHGGPTPEELASWIGELVTEWPP